MKFLIYFHKGGIFLKLYLTYTKLIFQKNKKYYFLGFLSIAASLFLLTAALFMVNIIYDYLLEESAQYLYNRIVDGILQAFCCTVICILIFIYYFKITIENNKYYGIIKALGATKKHIRIMKVIQILFSIMFTILLGYATTKSVADILKENLEPVYHGVIFHSINKLSIIPFLICIIIFHCYLALDYFTHRNMSKDELFEGKE
jgi:hypothetical protein